MKYIKFVWKFIYKLKLKFHNVAGIGCILIYLCYLIEKYIVIKSGLFDLEYYLLQREDVKKSSVDPIAHFILYGWKESSNPSKLFNTSFYQKNNSDVFFNPLVHYVLYGEKEGRKPHPVFNPDYYRLMYNSCLPNSICLADFLNHKKCASSAFFDIVFPERVIVKNTIVIDYDFSFLKNNIELCKKINYEFSCGNIDKALYLFMNEYNKYDIDKGKYFLGNVYCVQELRRNGTMVKEWNDSECRDIIQKLPGYNKLLNYPKAYIVRYDDVYLLGGTNLVFKENKIYNDEIFEYRSEDYGIKAWNNIEIDLVKNDKVFAHLKNISHKQSDFIERGILISCTHDNNYFHWMVESLPMLLFMMDNSENYSNYPLLIPSNLHSNYIYALQTVIDLNKIEVIKLKPNVMYKIKEIIIPSDLSRILDRYAGHMDYSTDIVLNPWYILKLRKYFLVRNNKPYRKLYLTRHSGTYRRLLNEQEIETYLVQHGFEIVDLAGVTFEFQQQLFSQAKLVIAPTGATMTNMLLSPPGCSYVVLYSNHEFCQNAYLDNKKCTLWDQLAQICSINLHQINGSRAYKRNDVHDDFYIPIKLIKDYLEYFGE